MADYFSPTVIQPRIPADAMTALEHLLLTHIFDSEREDDGLYFFAETSPNDLIDLPIGEVRAALTASQSMPTAAATFVRDHIQQNDADASTVELDFSVASWGFIFQDIVKRSTRLDHVTVVSAFTCTRMRPDGFGGMAMLITADAITSKTTNDIINDLLAEANLGHRAPVPGSNVSGPTTTAPPEDA